MKTTIEFDEDQLDRLVIAVLRSSAKLHLGSSRHPDDMAYDQEYLAAVNMVIAHFGGKKVKA